MRTEIQVVESTYGTDLGGQLRKQGAPLSDLPGMKGGVRIPLKTAQNDGQQTIGGIEMDVDSAELNEGIPFDRG